TVTRRKRFHERQSRLRSDCGNPTRGGRLRRKLSKFVCEADRRNEIHAALGRGDRLPEDGFAGKLRRHNRGSLVSYSLPEVDAKCEAEGARVGIDHDRETRKSLGHGSIELYSHIERRGLPHRDTKESSGSATLFDKADAARNFMATQSCRTNKCWDPTTHRLKQTIDKGLVVALGRSRTLPHGSQRHDAGCAGADSIFRQTSSFIQVDCICRVKPIGPFFGWRRHNRQCASKIVSTNHVPSL